MGATAFFAAVSGGTHALLAVLTLLLGRAIDAFGVFKAAVGVALLSAVLIGSLSQVRDPTADPTALAR